MTTKTSKFVIYKRTAPGSYSCTVHYREDGGTKRFVKQYVKRAKKELGSLYGGYYFTTKK
jgi:hypothetical protein